MVPDPTETPEAAGVPRWQRGAVFATVGGLSLLFMINLCDLIFSCGCHSLWNGAAEACNVHNEGTRNCPWCATGVWGQILPPVSVLLVQGAIALGPHRLGVFQRVVLSALAFPAVGTLAGLISGLATGYWS